MTEQNSQKSLAKICHLFCSNKFDEARLSILNAADVPWDERNFTSAEMMDDYILTHVKDPEIKKMAEADKAFTHLGHWYNHPGQLSETIMNDDIKLFKDLLPCMEQDDALRVKYWQSQMYVYPRLGDDKPRYDLLNNIICEYPLEYKDKDRMLEECAEQVSRLRVPVKERYKTIKTAQKKTSQEVRHHYNKMLAPIAEKYFELGLREADDDNQSYQTRLASYQEVYDVIDDIDISDDARRSAIDIPGKVTTMQDGKRHQRRLLILSRIQKLHKENDNQQEADKIKEKKTNLCFAYYKKYPQFKKQAAPLFDKI